MEFLVYGIQSIFQVKVLLRVAGPPEDTGSSWMTIDQRRKQVNLLDPSMMSAGSRSTRSTTALPLAPKMFSFDSIFSPDSSQGEICSASLVDLIHSVVNGVDACLISYGQAKLGKTTGLYLAIFPIIICFWDKSLSQSTRALSSPWFNYVKYDTV